MPASTGYGYWEWLKYFKNTSADEVRQLGWWITGELVLQRHGRCSHCHAKSVTEWIIVHEFKQTIEGSSQWDLLLPTTPRMRNRERFKCPDINAICFLVVMFYGSVASANRKKKNSITLFAIVVVVGIFCVVYASANPGGDSREQRPR